MLLVWGVEPAVQMENLRVVAALARECETSEIPLMVEPVLWGAAIPEARKADPVLVANACRIAVELGADIIKGPYVADQDALATLVRRTPVPVVLLGGPRLDDARAVLDIAVNSMRAGVRGIVFGRNVFQRSRRGRDDPGATGDRSRKYRYRRRGKTAFGLITLRDG